MRTAWLDGGGQVNKFEQFSTGVCPRSGVQGAGREMGPRSDVGGGGG